MNEIQVFKNPEFGTVRTVTIDNEPWFVGKDVAIVLGYATPKKAIYDHVESGDKRGFQIRTPGGEQEVKVINESGLYSLILSSKLPSAKRFKNWITSEVLPALRKTGRYEMQSMDYKPTRPITTDDYIDAGKTIAKCDNRRLSLVLDMFRKAGLDIMDIPKIPEVPEAPEGEINKVELVELLNQYSIRELCEKLPICKTSIYYYRIGKHFPHSERAKKIIRILTER